MTSNKYTCAKTSLLRSAASCQIASGSAAVRPVSQRSPCTPKHCWLYQSQQTQPHPTKRNTPQKISGHTSLIARKPIVPAYPTSDASFCITYNALFSGVLYAGFVVDQLAGGGGCDRNALIREFRSSISAMDPVRGIGVLTTSLVGHQPAKPEQMGCKVRSCISPQYQSVGARARQILRWKPSAWLENPASPSQGKGMA